MNYLFWNTNRKENINNTLKNLIKSFSCDVIGLAEYGDDIINLMKELSSEGCNLFRVPQIGCKRIEILTKYYPSDIQTFSESQYYTIRKIPHDTLGYILVSFVHLPSKLHKDNVDRDVELRYLKSDIEDAESMSSNDKSIIVGDFNVNPFEEPMISAAAAHSLSSKQIVQKQFRVVQNRKYYMFYNPMWNLLGDSSGPPGTYYYNNSAHINYFWNTFDQVIIRPSLIENFDINSLKIIDKFESISLVSDKGYPNISDHLPIYFKII